MKTQEANKLIAEFMDVDLIEGQLGEYHTSWDWLMPVITKLKFIDPDWIEEEFHIIDDIDDALTCCWGIEDVYRYTVEAIMNYNDWNTATNK